MFNIKINHAIFYLKQNNKNKHNFDITHLGTVKEVKLNF